MNGFILERFEYLCYSHTHQEEAARELLNILTILDSNYGSLNDSFSATPLQGARVSSEIIDIHVLSRIAAAASTLFSDPKFMFSDSGFFQMIPMSRWLSTLFAASPFWNADHVIRSLNKNGYLLDNLSIEHTDFAKFCMLYTPESEIPLDCEAFWNFSPILAANLFLVLMSPRFLGSSVAHAKREKLLQWFPDYLDKIERLDQLPIGILHDVYMNSSYADYRCKHNIKKPINSLIRRQIESWGMVDVVTKIHFEKGEKPVMLVVLEWFSAAHSIYRTHSTTLKAARDKFHIIGMGIDNNVDETGRAVFDEFNAFNNPNDMFQILQQVRDMATSKNAQILYMPSVGMFPLTMFLTNIRVAPIQVMALGHPATTHSSRMDYVVVEEDYVGDPSLFSETLLQLPNDALPYVPSAYAQGLDLTPILTEFPEVVQIAVCSTTMKLNPNFFETCRIIAERSDKKVHFHFLIGQSTGLLWVHINQVVKRYLGDFVTVYSHQNYATYMETIRHCDLFINPFPFGNTNGIVDTVSVGLVGVCLSGDEVHEHIDKGMFERLELPKWMVAHSIQEYIVAALRLINNDQERLMLRKNLINKKGLNRLFTGRPELLGEMLIKILDTATIGIEKR